MSSLDAPLASAIMQSVSDALRRDQHARKTAMLNYLVNQLTSLKQSHELSHPLHTEQCLQSTQPKHAHPILTSNDDMSDTTAAMEEYANMAQAEHVPTDCHHTTAAHMTTHEESDMSEDESKMRLPPLKTQEGRTYKMTPQEEQFQFPVNAIDDLTTQDHDRLVELVGGNEEQLMGKVCYCRLCFEHDTHVSFRRLAEGYRHVRETHVAMSVLEQHAGYVSCPEPWCKREFLLDRWDTMVPHLLKDHRYPPEPKRGKGQNRRVKAKNIKDKKSARHAATWVKDQREKDYGSHKILKNVVDAYWRSSPHLLRKDVKVERALHNAAKHGVTDFRGTPAQIAMISRRRNRRGPSAAGLDKARAVWVTKQRRSIRTMAAKCDITKGSSSPRSTPDLTDASTASAQSPVILTPVPASPDAPGLRYGYVAAQQQMLPRVHELDLDGFAFSSAFNQFVPVAHRCVVPEAMILHPPAEGSYPQEAASFEAIPAEAARTYDSSAHPTDHAMTDDWANIFAADATSDPPRRSLGMGDTFPPHEPYSVPVSDGVGEDD